MKYLFFVLMHLFCLQLFGQQDIALSNNRNPNYLVSQNRYMALKDSLISTEDITVQNTYHAYDWYKAKLERKEQRRQNRLDRRLANIYYNEYPVYYSPSPYYYPQAYYYRWFPLMPSIGYRSRNWWFYF